RAGHEHEENRVCDPRDLDLALPRSHRLDEHDVLAGRVEEENGLERGLGEAAEVTARPHGPDVDARIEEVIGQPDPIPEQRATRERARGIDGNDPDGAVGLADVADEGADEARLPHAGWAGHADDRGPSGGRVDLPHEGIGKRLTVLDERDRARERTPITGAYAGHELVERQ